MLQTHLTVKCICWSSEEAVGALQEQDRERAVRSLSQAGVSTSAQLLLNAKSELGGDNSNALHAQCLIRPETGQASLQKVSMVSRGEKY